MAGVVIRYPQARGGAHAWLHIEVDDEAVGRVAPIPSGYSGLLIDVPVSLDRLPLRPAPPLHLTSALTAQADQQALDKDLLWRA